MTKSKEALNRLYGFAKGTNNYYKQFLDSGKPMEKDMRLVERELTCVETLRKLFIEDRGKAVKTYKEMDYEDKEKIAKECGLSVSDIDNVYEVLLNG